jgi:hypothetical protein
VALAELHHLIEAGPAPRRSGAVLFIEPNARRTQKMSLLFYLPFIIWMGLFEVAQDEMRVPVKVIKATRRLDNDRTR